MFVPQPLCFYMKEKEVTQRRGRPKGDNNKYTYDPQIGLKLIEIADSVGSPVCRIRADFGLFSGQIEAWLGETCDGYYFNQDFFNAYRQYKNKREDYLTSMAMTGALSRDVWRCVAWMQLHSKVEPPKEITSKADVRTTMQVEDLHEIITGLENSKKSEGF